MNTLTDLRSTLGEHAEDVVDPAVVARATAVHHRIAAVRRRRRALGTGAVAAVVLAGVVGVVVPRSHENAGPAGPVVLGQRAPGTLHSLGYVYDATGRSQVVHGRGVVAIAKSSTPVLLSWTTDRPATVRFVTGDHEVQRTRITGFHDFLTLPAGLAQRVRVSADGADVGVATYALTDHAPAGYTRAGVTYREDVAGARLLGARIGDPGETEVTTSFVAATPRSSIAVMCNGLPKGDVVNVSLDGDGAFSSTGCDNDGTFDPGSAAFTTVKAGHVGDSVGVRVWISRGFHDQAPLPSDALPGFRLGVGAYSTTHQERLAGTTVPDVVESRGHTWHLSSTRSVAAGTPLRPSTAAFDRIASVVWHTHGHTVVDVQAGSQTPTGSSSPRGPGALPNLWLPAGAQLRASVTEGTGRLGVVFYERED